MQAWYLIYTKPRQERLALENLQRQGYESYLPLLRIKRRRSGKYVTLVEPMFPRYLFIHLSDQSDNWGPIRSTLGVANLVRFGELPGRVPDALVEALRGREDEEGIQNLPLPEFRSGERVRVADGPMAGYEGIFHAAGGKERVVILLDIVGRSARVKLPAGYIERA